APEAAGAGAQRPWIELAMEIGSAEVPPLVDEGQVILNDEPARVPSPSASRPVSPRLDEDPVLGALRELRREHGQILNEILSRLPPTGELRREHGQILSEIMSRLPPAG
ncbi:unnamed protein product, partial [Prorocentrum cordatum]